MCGKIVEASTKIAAEPADFLSYNLGYAKFFSIKLGPDAKLDLQGLECVSGKRVINHLPAVLKPNRFILPSS